MPTCEKPKQPQEVRSSVDKHYHCATSTSEAKWKKKGVRWVVKPTKTYLSRPPTPVPTPIWWMLLKKKQILHYSPGYICANVLDIQKPFVNNNVFLIKKAIKLVNHKRPCKTNRHLCNINLIFPTRLCGQLFCNLYMLLALEQ